MNRLAIAVCFLVFAQGLAQAQKEARIIDPQSVEKVDENDKLKFEQEKVAANMRELEDRMIKLSDLLRDTKPDDSARLLIGVESARQELILEQMRAVSDMLDQVDLSKASAEQKEVLAKLTKLKELLLNADLELRIKLEQLKRIKDARNKLAELIEKEQKQRTATQTAEQEKQDTQPLQKNENRNQKAGQSLKEQLTKISGSAEASESVGGACNSMGDASKCLGSGNCPGAQADQKKAIEQLQKADEQLAELEKKVQEQAEAAARQRVTELLSEMIDRETKVRDATVLAISKVEKEDPKIVSVLRRLAKVQDEITTLADECIEICELTQFSFVLPEALADVRERMYDVFTELEQARADDRLVQAEQQIISDLEELRDAMKQASKPGSPDLAKSEGSCCSNRNELLAEVKMLYWMQKSVNRKTKEIRDKEIAGFLKNDQLKAKTRQMKKQQDKIHDVTEKLRELTDPGFVNGDAI